MREVKFRAWDKRTECYLYNIQDAYDTLSGFVKYNDGEDADYDEDCFGNFLDNERYVVEQFIGMKDKNGKDIYENDILKVYRDWIDIVEFRNGSFGLAASMNHSFISFNNLNGEAEVIGNVHDNPELLEDKK